MSFGRREPPPLGGGSKLRTGVLQRRGNFYVARTPQTPSPPRLLSTMGRPAPQTDPGAVALYGVALATLDHRPIWQLALINGLGPGLSRTRRRLLGLPFRPSRGPNGFCAAPACAPLRDTHPSLSAEWRRSAGLDPHLAPHFSAPYAPPWGKRGTMNGSRAAKFGGRTGRRSALEQMDVLRSLSERTAGVQPVRWEQVFVLVCEVGPGRYLAIAAIDLPQYPARIPSQNAPHKFLTGRWEMSAAVSPRSGAS